MLKFQDQYKDKNGKTIDFNDVNLILMLNLQRNF